MAEELRLCSEAERNSVIGVPNMFVYVTARSKSEAEDWVIRLVDPMCPWSP